MSIGVARIRAILGLVFAFLGIVVGAQLMVRPVAMNQKLLGLAFAVVLIGLGFVRVRVYLKMKRETPA